MEDEGSSLTRTIPLTSATTKRETSALHRDVRFADVINGSGLPSKWAGLQSRRRLADDASSCGEREDEKEPNHADREPKIIPAMTTRPGPFPRRPNAAFGVAPEAVRSEKRSVLRTRTFWIAAAALVVVAERDDSDGTGLSELEPGSSSLK